MTTSIFDRMISDESLDPIIIVEMSGNHRHSLDAAEEFVRTAITAGPDVIKFQVYRPDTITLNCHNKDFMVPQETIWSSHRSLYELYKKAHTPWDWVAALAKICDAAGMPWFASPFDTTAIDFLEEIGCPAYKLASPEINDIGLIEHMAKTGKPIIFSTGLASLEDIDLCVETIHKYHDKFGIMKCTSAYPAPTHDLNLSAIPMLQKRYGCNVGYSDHSMGMTASIVAVAMGAKFIEKHFKLDGDDLSVDSEFSMPLSQLTELKTAASVAKQCLGAPTMEIPTSVLPSLSGRRSLYVTKAVKAGEIFTVDNVKSVRPNYGMAPRYLPEVLGATATQDLQIGDRLTEKMVNPPPAIHKGTSKNCPDRAAGIESSLMRLLGCDDGADGFL